MDRRRDALALLGSTKAALPAAGYWELALGALMKQLVIGAQQAAKLIAGAALLLALAGCETARDQTLLDDPNYSAGYSDGCATASRRVAGFDETITRDGARDSEAAYQIGWRDGYGQCGGGQTEATRASDREDIFTRDSEHYPSAPR